MSVLLTASKKKQPEKPKMQKRPSTSSMGSNGPPASTRETKVWHWNLDGTLTTVMFTDYSYELWCNGVTIHNAQKRFDPIMGWVTDFMICHSNTQRAHQGHVVHTEGGDHILYVDNYLIPEHTG